MKPFNLDKALAGEPVVTRDGRKVLDLYHFKDVKTKFSLVVFISGNSSVDHYTIHGTWTEDFENQELDLFMFEPETWINVYYSKVQDKIWNSVKYNSEKEAKENIVTTISSYLTTAQIL
jgi:hypothetical protein